MGEEEKGSAEKGENNGGGNHPVAGQVAGGVMVRLLGPIADEMGRDLAL